MPEELALAVVVAGLSVTAFVRLREARVESAPPPKPLPARREEVESAVRNQLYGDARTDAVVVLKPPRITRRRAQAAR
jgi:hypothetical protein